MTKIVLGPTGTKRRRWTLIGPLFLVAVVALIYTAGAQAVHDEQFQLDGDVLASTTTTVPPGPTPPAKTQLLDWDSFFDTLGAPISGSLTGGFTGSTFIRDFGVDPGCSLTAQSGTFCTADPTTYATGSKDTLDITPGWQCNFDHNVNSKIDIMNAYALSYTRADGHLILYFGMEKNAFTGTNDVGFWFIQGNANCDASTGTGSWTGAHQDGDVLVVSEFTSGGGVSNIFAYAWSDADGPGGTPGFLDPNPIGSGGDCKGNTGGDSICATTNSGPDPITGTITTPWLTSNKNDGVGNSLRATEFFEGGIDITTAFAGSTAPTCFNTFLGDTRSSVSLTATLFDYARGQLGGCGASMTTQPSTSTCVIGSCSGITDTATVTGTAPGGTAPTPTGNVTFYLCSPSQLTPANTGTCGDSNGTQVGAVKAVSGSGSTATATSDAVPTSLITVLGKYCFRAQFVGTGDYLGKDAGTSNAADECFTVTGTSALASAQRWLPNDRVVLTGDANLNGTLTITLYTGDNCGATSGSAVTGQSYSIPVSNAPSGSAFNTTNTTFFVGTNPDGTAGGAPGAYSWLVHYDDTTLSDPADHCESSNVTITD
jgi:hypothetical protein